MTWLHARSRITFVQSHQSDPLRPYSLTQTGSEQTYKQLDQRILEELHNRVYEDVGNFYQRYFAEKEWSNNNDKIYQKLQRLAREQRLAFAIFRKKFFDELRDRFVTSANWKLLGSDCDRHLAIFMVPPIECRYDWGRWQTKGERKDDASAG